MQTAQSVSGLQCRKRPDWTQRQATPDMVVCQQRLDPTCVQLVCDRQGQILSVNSAASQVYGVEVSDTIEILPFEPEDIDGLRTALESAEATFDPHCLILRRARGRTPVIARLESAGAWVRVSTTDFFWPTQLNRELKRQFDLSLAELAVLELVVEGFSVAQIAEARGCSIATVRCQQRAIFEKLCVNTMTELLRASVSFACAIRPIDICPDPQREGRSITDIEYAETAAIVNAATCSSLPIADAMMRPDLMRVSLDALNVADEAFFRPDGTIIAAYKRSGAFLRDGREATLTETDISPDALSQLRGWARTARPNHWTLLPYSIPGDSYLHTCLLVRCLNVADAARASTREDDQRVLFATALNFMLYEDIANVLTADLGLSPAEAEIARTLAEGYTPAAIADMREASINTVRTQIKSVLKKLGARGIPDLVRMLCALSVLISSSGSR